MYPLHTLQYGLLISYTGRKCQYQFLLVYLDIGQLHSQFGGLVLQLYNFVANRVLTYQMDNFIP